MGFVGFGSIMPYINVFSCLFLIFVHYTMFVLCCAYHVHDKMSPRCFLVFLWISLDTMVVGIIMFL